MNDRTSRDASPGQCAELTGIVSQLTTPSRHHGELVDLWFGVQWHERGPEWDEAFAQLVENRRPDPLTPSFFALFAHASTDGLIVARHVRRDAGAWRRAEDEARALISAVNARVDVERTPPPSQAAPRRSWSMRVRDASAFLASIRWLGEQKRRFPVVADLPIQVTGSSSRASG